MPHYVLENESSSQKGRLMNDRNGTMEKLTNNLMTIFLARGAMIVTPVVFSFFVYVGFQVLDDIRNRVAATELQISTNSKIIQDHESRITLSILDRLLDYEPEVSQEAFGSRSRNLRQLKQAVRRDLEWLLNTREYIGEIPPALTKYRMP